MKKVLEAARISMLFPILTGVCFVLFLTMKTLDKIVRYTEKQFKLPTI